MAERNLAGTHPNDALFLAQKPAQERAFAVGEYTKTEAR